jgi:hypothetical protein
MRRISIFSGTTLVLVTLSFTSFSQVCTATVYNFNAAVNTQGFTGMQTSGTGTFSAFAVSNNELRSTVTASSTNTFIITSATFNTSSNPITFSFAFSKGSQATVSNVQYLMKYVNGSNTVVQTAPVAYVNNTCTSIPRPGAMSTNDYQIVAIYTVTVGNGNTSNSYIGYDDFATNGTLSAIVLPVNFSAFRAEMNNTGVSLTWSVGTEDNLTSYEIEKSIDGSDYSKIGLVNATGRTSYSFLDARPSTTAYYRIRSVDAMGRYTYSSIAFVKEGKSIIILKAFPTPFTKTVSVQHATAGAGSLITVSSQDGRLVKSVLPVQGTQQTDIDLSGTTAGIYLLRFVDSNGSSQTLKILKK